MGKKKRPFYRLVVLDSRKRRDGAYLANLGYYNPFVEPPEVKLHTEEIISWLGKGATTSGTARSLLKREGVLYRYSLLKKGIPVEEIETAMNEWSGRSEVRIQRKEKDRVAHWDAIAEAEQERRDTVAKEKAAEAAGEAAADEPAAAEETADEPPTAEAADGDASDESGDAAAAKDES